MAVLNLPMKTSASSSAVAYDTALDAAYSVYTAVIKNYPVANAFVDTGNTSQEKWGLQVTARSTQNNAWKTLLTYGVGSGTGAFALYSITYGFTRTISKLESGNVQTMFYQNGYTTLDFDETNSKIGNVKLNPMTADLTNGSQAPAGFIATNTNKFLCIVNGRTLSTYPVTASGSSYVLTSTTAAGTYTMPTNINQSGTPSQYGFVAAAKNQYVWIVSVESDAGSSVGQGGAWGYLISVSSVGVPTLVGAGVALNNYTGSGGSSGTYHRQGGGTYVINNVAHCFTEAQFGNTGTPTHQTGTSYDTIDLNTVSAFTKTNVRQTNDGTNARSGVINGALTVGYDGTGLLVVTNIGTAGTPDIYKIIAASYTDTGSNYLAPYNYACRYSATTAKLSTAAQNTVIRASTGTGFTIKGVDHTGTFTNLYNKHIWIYEMTGTNQEDDSSAFKGVYIPTQALGSTATTGGVTLKLNGTLVGTKENILNPNGASANMNFTLSATDVNASKLTFLLEYTNLNAQDSKLGFGLSGGTYASPTGNYETSTLNLMLV